MQGAQHPHGRALELVGRRPLAQHRTAGCAGRVQNEPLSHARDARGIGSDDVQSAAARPHDRAVGALDDAATGIHYDGLARAARLRGGAQRDEAFEIGPLDGGFAARVVTRRGEHHLPLNRRARPEE